MSIIEAPIMFPAMLVSMARMVTIAMSVLMARTVTIAMSVSMAMTGLTLQDKLGKVWFFQETFLLADISLVLEMPFLTLSSALVEKEIVWRIYIATDTLLVEGSIRPKLMCPPAPLISMLRTSSSTDLSTSTIQWLSMMGLMMVVVVVAILTGSFI